MERFVNCESGLGGDEMIGDRGDVGVSDKPLAKSLQRTGSPEQPGSAQGAGCRCRLPEAAARIPSLLRSSPISGLYLGLDVIQRKGNRDGSEEGPGSSPTTAWAP